MSYRLIGLVAILALASCGRIRNGVNGRGVTGNSPFSNTNPSSNGDSTVVGGDTASASTVVVGCTVHKLDLEGSNRAAQLGGEAGVTILSPSNHAIQLIQVSLDGADLGAFSNNQSQVNQPVGADIAKIGDYFFVAPSAGRTAAIQLTIAFDAPTDYASFDFIDMDGGETLQVIARDAMGQNLHTRNYNANSPGAGDGRAMPVVFGGLSAKIKSLHLTTNTGGLGYGLDNIGFVSCP